MESCAHPLLDTLLLQNRRMRPSMCLVLLLFLRLCISVYITHSCSLLYLGQGDGEQRYGTVQGKQTKGSPNKLQIE